MTEIKDFYYNYAVQIEQIFIEISKLSESENTKNFVKLHLLRKNQFLLKEGEYCKFIYFSKSGILRNYYLKDGNEVITTLSLPLDISVVLRSSLLSEPSREYIQAVTDCEIYAISVLEFEKLKQKFTQLEKIELNITQFYALWLEDRLYSLQFLTAAERYQRLLEREPLIVKFVPLSYIASYLGITLETLSRIRAKI